jgi:tetratricopeptide (TPR) repeat protein
MFEEVLEIDPEDSLATFGMGMARMQLGEYDKALPYFARAAELQKDYSVAYLNLGKCHEFLGNSEDAAAAYRQGIRAAGRKGDLIPMREMERRLNSLKGRNSAVEPQAN